jgi:5-hydroxyisourate hydrolase
VTAITTHVLDVALGKPAAGVPVRLERLTQSGVAVLGQAATDQDGRARDLGPADLPPGTYRLVFDTAAYRRAQQEGTQQQEAQQPGEPPFFPEVTVTFTVGDQARDYHVPLLLSPFGYSTYRGS